MMQDLTLWKSGARLRTDAETEIFYRCLIPAAPQLILIFIHGAGQHSGLFLEIGEYCVRHAVAFYALDLRGFGESSGQRGHIQCFSQYLDDLSRFIEYVNLQHPGKPVFMLGHSLGGTVVVRFAEEHPGCVQGVILSSPALRPQMQLPRSLYFLCHVLSLLTPTLSLEVERWSKYGSRIHSMGPFFRYIAAESQDALSTDRFSVRWCTELLSNGERALRDAKEFKFSLLCLCGADDPLIDPSAVQAFHRMVPVRDKECIVFAHRQHRLLEGDLRHSVYARIVNWLQERAKAQS